MFISSLNYICLIGCSPEEMPRCWHVGGNCLLFALQTENLTGHHWSPASRPFLTRRIIFVSALESLLNVWRVPEAGGGGVGVGQSFSDFFFLRKVVSERGFSKRLRFFVNWLATSGGRVPVVAVCVLYGQLRICWSHNRQLCKRKQKESP